MKSIIRTCAVALGFLCGAAVHAQTPANVPPPNGPMHVVSYYEVLPTDRMPAKGERPRQIFSDYVERARNEPGALSFDVLHDIEKHNRYVVLEVWRDDAAFQQHKTAASARELADALQPWLLGPRDQRVHTELR